MTVLGSHAPIFPASQLLCLTEEAVGLQNRFSDLLHQTRDSFLESVWPEVPEGEPQVITDFELRVRPSFPNTLPSTLLFSARW